MADALVILFPVRTYSAKLQTVSTEMAEFRAAGTLDGFIDFAVSGCDGHSRTYILTRDEARQIIAALHSVMDDVQQNCLYDRDTLLQPESSDR
jgi:hypothetical protein